MFIKYKRIGQNAFEKNIGIAPGHLHGVKNISDKLCDKISQVYPELSVEWIQEGSGEMLKLQPISQTIGDNNHDIVGNVQGSGHTITHNDSKLVSKLHEIIYEKDRLIERVVEENNRRDDEKFMMLKERDSQTGKSLELLGNQLESKDSFIMQQGERIDRLIAIIEKFSGK
jgi:hypothetical protein